MIKAYLGLGSNLDYPRKHVALAMDELDGIHGISIIQRSSLYQTKPVGPQDQHDFINAVVSIETTLEPQALLTACQELENKHGRQHIRKWGERTLDIDILLYGKKQIQLSNLIVPHPHMFERDFVLIPLTEIAPNLVCSLQKSC